MTQPAPHPVRLADPDAGGGERNYAAGNHLVGLLSLMDMTVLGLVGAIVMWRVRASDSPYLDDHGREAVNFQLSLLLYTVVGAIVIGVLTLGIGLLVWVPLLYVLRIVGAVLAAVSASKGEFYRYPVCIRFLKGEAG